MITERVLVQCIHPQKSATAEELPFQFRLSRESLFLKLDFSTNDYSYVQVSNGCAPPDMSTAIANESLVPVDSFNNCSGRCSANDLCKAFVYHDGEEPYCTLLFSAFFSDTCYIAPYHMHVKFIPDKFTLRPKSKC